MLPEADSLTWSNKSNLHFWTWTKKQALSLRAKCFCQSAVHQKGEKQQTY